MSCYMAKVALLIACHVFLIGQTHGKEGPCYDELGCFPMDFPWTSLTRPFPDPQPPGMIDTRLYCYTRDSPERYNVSLWPQISLSGCPFQSNRTTMFLTHGFVSDGNTTWMAELKDNYLEVVDANVFLVDWGNGAKKLSYFQVASNTRVVAAECIRFVRYLQEEHSLNASRLHFIGHSLGAHVLAYVAKNITGVDRLTALDPAQPGFEATHKTVRLDINDADFVDVVHTTAAPFIPTLGVGLILPYGDVDFYMNGGAVQPGCSASEKPNITSLEDLAKFPVERIADFVSCSHGRSHEYFSAVLKVNCTIWGHSSTFARQVLDVSTLRLFESLLSKEKKTCDADSCLPLGLHTPEYVARGVFSAATPAQPPFCNDPEENETILNEISESSTSKLMSTEESDGHSTMETSTSDPISVTEM